MTRNVTKDTPAQHTGAQSQTILTRVPGTEDQANRLYEIAKGRLLDINNWHTVADGGAHFTLTDASGTQVNRTPAEGDCIRIAIPVAPGPKAGNGEEWVRVEQVQEKKQDAGRSVVMLVRPTSAPVTKEKSIAHFFTDEATSTFKVEQDGNKVSAMVIGRNEVPNTKSENLLDRVRNLFIGLGAMAGLNKPQWKKLVNGLLKEQR